MILISNHLVDLPEFKKLENITIRINMAHVKNKQELDVLLKSDYDIFLDYPKGRSKPPTPTLHVSDALEAMAKYPNIKYFAVSNIETPSEVNMINNCIPDTVNFVPKIETLNGVLNLASILETGHVKHIMLDTEDLYTDVKNDIELYLQLKDRSIKVCREFGVGVLELHGVVFKSE